MGIIGGQGGEEERRKIRAEANIKLIGLTGQFGLLGR